jgi:antitoxin (DNA-binding transcriptional repressor) of toxin-antitoxin stability system
MRKVTLELAQEKLPELLRNLASDEDLLITEGNEPLAKVTKAAASTGRRDVFGCCKGMFQYQAGWDGPEEDFKPYSE